MSSRRPPHPQSFAPKAPPVVNVDLAGATDVTCDNCGNYTFQEVVFMKRLSAIQSPTGKEGNVPIPTFACAACGFVNNMFLPPFMRKAETEQTPEQPTAELGTDDRGEPLKAETFDGPPTPEPKIISIARS